MAGTYLTPVGSGMLTKVTKQRQSFHHGSSLNSHRHSKNKLYFNNTDLIQMTAKSVLSLANSSIILKISSSNSIHILYMYTYNACLTKKWANFIPYHRSEVQFFSIFNFVDLYLQNTVVSYFPQNLF